ncbi:hypothetical protein NS274_01580 [Pseudomonas oryzihabitans]|nr:hypothetical protein NS274_01580 [Pseudomonas psychrotolerans]KTT60767.1 hypothetical protein NS383_24170 [Pseudomonas psychrotolerans]
MDQANGLKLLLLAAIWGASFLFMRTFLVPPFGAPWVYMGALVIGLAVWLVLHSESTVKTRR